MESSQPKNHEDHIAGKGFTSMSQYNLAHWFIPMPQVRRMKNTKKLSKMQGKIGKIYGTSCAMQKESSS